MQVGDTFEIGSMVYPENAEDKTIIYNSENKQIADIDANGIIKAFQEGETEIYAISKKYPEIKAKVKVIVVRQIEEGEINFDSSLNLNGLEISGLDIVNNTVGDLKSKITTEFELEFLNGKNKLLTDEELIGTGGKIVVKEQGKVLREYKIILYGDINGDGRINSVDLLILQRHILEIEKIEGIYLKAANVRKKIANPTSIDLLLIQRHILEIQFINQ